MISILRPSRFCCLIGALLFISANPAWSAAAVVTSLNGTVSSLKVDGSYRTLAQNSQLEVGETITTEKNSFAKLKFTDGGEITLRPETTLALSAYSFNQATPDQDSFAANLIKSGLRTITGLIGKRGKRDAYSMSTTTATIGIRGTDYGTYLCDGNCSELPDGQYFDVKSGRIVVFNKAGELEVGEGQYAFAKDANSLPVLLPKDPGILDFDESETVGAGLGTFLTGVIPGSGCYVQ